MAERSGRPADDEAVVALAGAVIGVGLAAWFESSGSLDAARFLARMDAGLALLESGFRF